jgi:LEA14-like dessication related protein
MNKNILLIGAGLYAAYFLLRKRNAGQSVKWNITGIDIKRKALTMQIINPTNTPINFDALVSDVSLNGANVGIIDFRQKTLIPGAGSKNIIVPIKLNALGVIQFLTSKAKQIKQLGFEGTINAEGVSFPFFEKFNLANV